MRMTKTNRYLLVLTALLLVACHSGKENEDVQQNMEMHQQEDVEAYVDTMVLHQTQFNKQIVCNGKLAAKAKSELNFNIQGVIDDVMVKEGQRVDKGTLIATLDKSEKRRELEKAEHELERAKVELTDKLLGLGYEDWEKVPADVMKRAEVMSGLCQVPGADCQNHSGGMQSVCSFQRTYCQPVCQKVSAQREGVHAD